MLRYSYPGIIFRRWAAKRLFFLVYLFQNLYIEYKLFWINDKKPLVVILTIGKVGSSSVYFSIKKQFTSRIFHIHYISEKGVEESWSEHKNSHRDSVPLHLINSRILQRKLKKYKGKVYIITVVREPIQRKISSFFQNLDKFRTLSGLRIENTDKFFKVVNDGYIKNLWNEEDNWIKNELVETFNFEVYQTSEVKTKGFIIEKSINSHLLLLKMETLDIHFSKAVKIFFETEKNISLIPYNEGGAKYYSEAYNEFKKKFSLEKSTVDLICNTKYFKSFYQNQYEQVLQKYLK